MARVISRNTQISYDLKPFDYLLFGYVKSQVDENNPNPIPEVKELWIMPLKILLYIGDTYKRSSFVKYCFSSINATIDCVFHKGFLKKVQFKRPN